MFAELHSSIQKDSQGLNLIVDELNYSWEDLFKIIRSPSFLELAKYIKPNVTKHPMNDLYVYFLDSQIEQTQYTENFWKKLTEDNYLFINSDEERRYLKYFQEQIVKNSEHMGNMLNFYFEHNKPMFFSNFTTAQLSQCFSLIKNKFIDYFKEGYIKLSNEYHHLVDEENEQYFYTAQRFFPSFPHIHKVFSYIDDKINKEFFDTLSFEEQGLLIKIFQSIFYNETYFHQVFFYFINIFNEEIALNELGNIGQFPITHLSEMSRLYFLNNHCTEENFKKINFLSKQIQHNYQLRNYYNLTLAHKDEDERVEILIYSPLDTIEHLSSLNKHLSYIKNFYNFTCAVNKQVIIGSHIPLCYKEMLPVACFSHFFNHKTIHCDFTQFNKNDTAVLVHEYQHLLDNLFLNQIIDTSKEDAKFFHLSSTFPVEFQNIFSSKTTLAYKNTLLEPIQQIPLLSKGYSALFQNFLYSLTSKFSISEEIINSNESNINFISEINNLISPVVINTLLECYKVQLSTTKFSDPFFNNMAKDIIHRYFESDEKNKLYEYLSQQFERSLLNFCVSKYTINGINFMLDSYQNNFDFYEEHLISMSIYEKELFLIPFNLSSYDEIVQKMLFTELISSHYSVGNALCSLNPEYKELFNNEQINPYENTIQIINENSFINDFVNTTFKTTCSKLISKFKDLEEDIKSIVNRYEQIDIISISNDSNFRKTFFPIPDIFNHSIQKTFQHPNIEYSIYLNYPSEILARNTSVIFDLENLSNSKFFSIIKSKDIITNIIDNSDTNFSLRLKDFDKKSLKQILKNHHVFLMCLEKSLTFHPDLNSIKSLNIKFLPYKENDFEFSNTTKRKFLKLKK